MRRVLLLALLLGGCHHNADFFFAEDMMVGPRDLGMPTDFAIGTANDGAVSCMTGGGGAHAQYVWNAITLPKQRTDDAFDLNGDGRTDNALGNLEAALASQGLDRQMDESGAVMSGQSVTLLDEGSIDSTFTTDSCASSSVYAGTPTTAPDFSGHGHFVVDASATVGAFTGTLASARFVSQPSPADAKVPVTLRLPPGILGTIFVDIVGARITYARTAGGTVAGGQVNGAIREKDVQTKVIPGMANALNLVVQSDPTSAKAMQALAVFDNGGTAAAGCSMACKNLDGSCAKANDGVISDCEFGSSPLMQNALAPDVQLFDASGNYRPNPANTQKDSLSVGFGFTAVPATF